MHLDIPQLREATPSKPDHAIIDTMSLAQLERIYHDVRRIVTSDIPVPTREGGIRLSEALTSEHQGRWKRYWTDQGSIPSHTDMNMAGHLVRTEQEIIKLTSCFCTDNSSLRIKNLLLITGWIHDLGELAGGDELFQSIDLSSRHKEKAAFYTLMPILFGELDSDAQTLLRALYDAVALPLEDKEKHPTLEPFFECIEKLGYLRTALEVGKAQPTDVQANLLSTSVFHYHQRWFARERSVNHLLQFSLEELTPALFSILNDKRHHNERTRAELRAELELEVAMGKRATLQESDIDVSFTNWWELCSATGHASNQPSSHEAK